MSGLGKTHHSALYRFLFPEISGPGGRALAGRAHSHLS